MTSLASNPVVGRCLAVSALAGAAWVFTVRPAQAEYAEARRRLEAQSAEAAAFAGPGVSASGAADALAATRAFIAQLEQDLTRPPGSTPVFSEIEHLAQAHGVEVLRTHPRGTVDTPTLGGADEPAVFADQFSLDLTGSYAGITGFLGAMRTEIGQVRVSLLRLSPTTPGQARAEVEFAAYRLKPGVRLVADPEAADAKD